MSYLGNYALKYSSFDAKQFYEKYKGAFFMMNKSHVRDILSKQVELECGVDNNNSGRFSAFPGNTLMIKKSRRIDERDVPNDEFTARRLRGLAAAYVLDNDSKFPDIIASEAEDLGLVWNKQGRYPAKIYHQIYLSAVSGAEYFVDHFGFYPLVCALKQYQLGRITAEMLIDVTKIRSKTGERVSTRSIYPQNGPRLNFLGTFDLTKAIDSAPEEVKWIFKLGDSSEGKKLREFIMKKE